MKVGESGLESQRQEKASDYLGTSLRNSDLLKGVALITV
jgi:hypothetical protein